MTFEEWQKTGRAADPEFTHLIDNAFGYVPDNCIGARLYDPGIIAILPDGQFFTHIDRSEYTGKLDEIERRLWEDYASRECRAWNVMEETNGEDRRLD